MSVRVMTVCVCVGGGGDVSGWEYIIYLYLRLNNTEGLMKFCRFSSYNYVCHMTLLLRLLPG